MAKQGKGAVAIAGGTGLVGRVCLNELLRAPDVDDVVVLGRRPVDVNAQANAPTVRPRAHSMVVDFARLEEGPAPVRLTAAACALGTTIAKAGSQAAFRAVDCDAVVAFARWAHRHGATTFALVSSVGADAGASSFYLRVKADAEAGVAAIGFSRVVVLRPSLLLGAREESRPGEAFARALFPVLGPVMVGPMRRYRGIPATAVGHALAAAVRTGPSGLHVWHYEQIIHAAARDTR